MSAYYESQVRKSIPLATPDFDAIKSALKTYLKGQDKFTDYDFEGSVMSTLLDLLSYNTHFQAFYLNLVGNEAFLSTAVKRDSVVARAKDLGYTPKSAICASATLFLEMTSATPVSFIDVPENTIFNATVQGSSYIFRTLDTQRVFRNSSGTYSISGLEIVEGKKLTHTFTIGDDEIISGVVIPNPNVDATRLRVLVRDNTTSASFERYERADDIVAQDEESKVYYISEIEGGLTKIYFGDGVISRALILGGEVKIEYLISSGEAPNSIGAFSLSSSIPGALSTTLLVESAATGGALPETIESIKFRAPKSYEAQNRAVTPDDYIEILRNNYSNLEDVICWGGEDNVPPQFGKVFISIQPIVGFFITSAEKEKIQTLLKKFNVVTVKPVVVDADYVFVSVASNVDYDSTQTDKSDGQMSQIVSNAIYDYNSAVLSKFDNDLRFSVLVRNIDSSEPSIISNSTTLLLSKRIYPIINVPQDLNVTFGNQIKQGTVTSSTFTFNGFSDCFFEETVPSGKLNISKFSGASKIIVAPNIADVDYVNGSISASSIEFDMVPSQYVDEISLEPYIKIWATPVSTDIFANQRQIIEIDETMVTMNRLV